VSSTQATHDTTLRSCALIVVRSQRGAWHHHRSTIDRAARRPPAHRVWLDDPDGVAQYVTATGESRAAAAPEK